VGDVVLQHLATSLAGLTFCWWLAVLSLDVQDYVFNYYGDWVKTKSNIIERPDESIKNQVCNLSFDRPALVT